MKNMGNLKTLFKTPIKKDRNDIGQIGKSDFEVIQTIWRIVEKDSATYGYAMCTTLYKNYPQYAKYFEDEAIPEFIREAKVKKKFTTICDIVSTLFINYYNKPTQREYLLGYIAMIHKDMGLTIQDFENFISCVVEALCTELPHLMTSEKALVQLKYFNILCETMLILMDKHRVRIDELLRSGSKSKKICSACFSKRTEVIYNYPLKYWLYKKRYWEYRRAVWASLVLEPRTATTVTIEQHRTRMPIRRQATENKRVNERRQSKVINTIVNSDKTHPADYKSENGKSIQGSWLLANIRKQKDPVVDGHAKVVPLKTIHEVQRDKTARELKGIQDSSSATDNQQDYEPTLPPSVQLHSPTRTTAVSKRIQLARTRRRERDYPLLTARDSSST